MADGNSIVDELKEAFKDLGIPETSESTQDSVKSASSFDPKKINEVIFLEKQVVEPERLNGIREIISKWSNNIPHHDLTNLGEKIEIVAVIENPSYIIELQTLYEQRTLKRGVKPFRGEKLSPKTITEAGVDVWANPTADEKDFKEEKKNYIIDGSSEVLECEKCDGAGEFICGRCGGDKTQTCPGCKGEGEVKCRKCGGEGTIKCSSCSGNGQIKCSACSGKGSIRCGLVLGCGGTGYTGSGNNRRMCPFCKGAGSKPCNSCGTRGHKPCTACGSRGYKQCDSCKNGYKTCEKCNRRGIVTCGGCNGRGIVICSLCEGKKSVIKFLYYEDIFSPNATDELVHSLNQPLINSIVESDKNNAHVVVDITQAEISGNIFDTMQHDAVKQNLTKLLVTSKTVSTLGAYGTNYRILKQRISINKYDIVIVNYRHLSKSYSLLIHGTNTKTVYVKTSPIHQLVDNYLTSAGQLFKQKEYSQAFDLVEKILNISPEKVEAKELKKEILDRINAEYALGGLSGGLTTTLFFRLAWAHNSLPFWGNTWWETIKVSILLFVGVLIGLMTAAIFAHKSSTKIKESRKRVLYPFIASILSTIILVVSWNLATKKLWRDNAGGKSPKEIAAPAKKTVTGMDAKIAKPEEDKQPFFPQIGEINLSMIKIVGSGAPNPNATTVAEAQRGAEITAMIDAIRSFFEFAHHIQTSIKNYKEKMLNQQDNIKYLENNKEKYEMAILYASLFNKFRGEMNVYNTPEAIVSKGKFTFGKFGLTSETKVSGDRTEYDVISLVFNDGQKDVSLTIKDFVLTDDRYLGYYENVMEHLNSEGFEGTFKYLFDGGVEYILAYRSNAR